MVTKKMLLLLRRRRGEGARRSEEEEGKGGKGGKVEVEREVCVCAAVGAKHGGKLIKDPEEG